MVSQGAQSQDSELDSIAYVNGEFAPLKDARISILDRGFVFGDGIYEVSAVLQGKLVDNEAHFARLERSAAAIELDLPATPAKIEEIQKELVARNGLVEGIVYLQVTRGPAIRDFKFPKAARPSLVLFVQRKQLVNSPEGKTGIRVKTVPDLRWARRDIKSVGLLAQVLAKQAAFEAGCQEAWMVQDDLVVEGGSSSAFIVTGDDVILARPNSTAVLPGCTRRAILALAEERGMRLEERAFSVSEALAAKEAFITSASSFVQSVVRIDDQVIGSGIPGPVATRLRELYIDFAVRTAR